MFENTRSWVVIGTYIQSREILENGLNKKLKTYQVIHFYTLNPYWTNALFLDSSRRILFSGGTR